MPDDKTPPDLPLERLVDLLDAEILLDEVRDAPARHWVERLGEGIAAAKNERE